MKERTELHMWSYWREKKGIKRALVEWYPEVLHENENLRMALFQKEEAEALIERVMTRLEDEGSPDGQA